MRRFPWFEVTLIIGLAMALIMKPATKTLSAAPEPTITKSSPHTLVGEMSKLGDGTVRSWVHIDSDGHPTSVGFTLTETALGNLPETTGIGCCGDHEYVLRLPNQASIAPFTHLVLNWNSKGHQPAGIYDQPHFDFHFYMQPNESRKQIGANDAAHLRFPSRDTLPEKYVDTHEGVPKMGMHWVNPRSDEFVGKGFSKTFIYGSYDGQVTFLEPMITKALLESKRDHVEAIPQPKIYPSGYFPTTYTIRFDPVAKEYSIALEGLTLH